MKSTFSLVPIVADAAIAVSSSITDLVTKAKASGVIRQAQLESLMAQTAKVLADARIYHAAELVTTNIEQLGRAQGRIDELRKQGLLHGSSLEMSMEQLCDLNDILRQNLRQYANSSLRRL
jgi:hypothetical protein